MSCRLSRICSLRCLPVAAAVLLACAPARAAIGTRPGQPMAAPTMQKGGDISQAPQATRDRASRLDVSRLDGVIRDAHATADAAGEAGDRALAHRMNLFARKAADLRARAGDRRTQRESLNRDLAQLAREARAIQRDAARGRAADAGLRASWARLVRVLDEVRGASGEVRGTSGTSPEPERPADRDRAAEREARPATDRGATGRDAPGTTDAASLADELARRLRRAEGLADRPEVGDARALIDHFAGRASSFGQEFGSLSREDRQGRAATLLEEARQAQQSLTRHNASPELVDAWNEVIEVLVRMSAR